jgi:[acyl-carrier-protein] S-malonyltransferase
MGQALAENYPAAKAVFEEINDALGQDLSTLMWSGTDTELMLTFNAQPALMAVSMAAMRALESEGIILSATAQFVAGHSLGEYAALAAAGSISISDAARLLRTRGTAMQEAVSVGEGAMAAILGLTVPQVQEIAESAAQGNVCQVANDNADGQVVVSGHTAAVDRAVDIAKASGAKRAILLPVSAPFHCALMEPAAEVMQDALMSVNINEPVVPLVANVLAAPITDPTEIRARLVEQVTGTVRWRESVLAMAAAGVTSQLEIGAGKVLTGLARRIDRNLTARTVGTPDDIAVYLSHKNGEATE